MYAGQESGATHRPTLFDIEKVEWGDRCEMDFLTRLMGLKKSTAMQNGILIWTAAEPVVQAVWCNGQDSLYGVFNVSGAAGELEVTLPDGVYQNLLDDLVVQVADGKMKLPEVGVVVQFDCPHLPRAAYGALLDFVLPE